ncbi:MAG: sigma 54-interacting transcriptional regulator [Myxococcota bacterium]|nr:sigma 54-interacting transcriptional regulator [Myxococcota bacterium]
MSTSNFAKTGTGTKPKKKAAFGQPLATPGLLVAFAPPGAVSTSRVEIVPPFIIGRDKNSDLCITDGLVSRHHAQITRTDDDVFLEDLKSSNGTFVSGYRAQKRQIIICSEVVRIGDAVLIFQSNINPGKGPQPAPSETFIGDFHAIEIFRELTTAMLTDQPLLLVGPSGSGKELLVQRYVAELREKEGNFPFVSHNMARFTSEAEIVSTLFGVSPGVFSGVDARPGLIEEAAGGVLFLDEVHNLPLRVQRSLLKIVEDGVFSRIGESRKRKIRLRFVMASNAAEPDFGLAHDLLARFFVLQLPSLKKRAADIPCIFNHLLRRNLKKFNLPEDSLNSILNGDHYEALCLDGFTDDNVRGVDNFVSKLVASIATGNAPEAAVAAAFSERFANGPVARRYLEENKENGEASPASHYEQNRALIVDAFKKCQGSITATHRMLEQQGIACSRRWLSIFLDRWGVRKARKNTSHHQR